MQDAKLLLSMGECIRQETNCSTCTLPNAKIAWIVGGGHKKTFLLGFQFGFNLFYITLSSLPFMYKHVHH
ncbi:hypothetical protein Syun_022769 [Stephania yunnanensis]|uniref:Uncharacterized protein n=1 Tax=Stephania yunnanensis TaxID=152371 RepID=A0AAP0FE72_9MAGN